MASAIIDTAASGDVTIVTAPPTPGLLRILGYSFITGGSDSVYFAAGADSVKLTGTFVLTAQAGLVCPGFESGWFDLPTATALIVNKAAAIQLGGHVRYEIIR